jgi:hypothetical protein
MDKILEEGDAAIINGRPSGWGQYLGMGLGLDPIWYKVTVNWVANCKHAPMSIGKPTSHQTCQSIIDSTYEDSKPISLYLFSLLTSPILRMRTKFF